MLQLFSQQLTQEPFRSQTISQEAQMSGKRATKAPVVIWVNRPQVLWKGYSFCLGPQQRCFASGIFSCSSSALCAIFCSLCKHWRKVKGNSAGSSTETEVVLCRSFAAERSTWGPTHQAIRLGRRATEVLGRLFLSSRACFNCCILFQKNLANPVFYPQNSFCSVNCLGCSCVNLQQPMPGRFQSRTVTKKLN